MPKPAPKKVPMVQAQRVFRAEAVEAGVEAGVGLVVLGVGSVFIGIFLLAATQVFEDFGVEDRRADFIDAHGPFAEVNLAATIAAEGKILVCAADEHSAGGAMEKLGGFFPGGHCEDRVLPIAAKIYGNAARCSTDFSDLLNHVLLQLCAYHLNSLLYVQIWL